MGINALLCVMTGYWLFWVVDWFAYWLVLIVLWLFWFYLYLLLSFVCLICGAVLLRSCVCLIAGLNFNAALVCDWCADWLFGRLLRLLFNCVCCCWVSGL